MLPPTLRRKLGAGGFQETAGKAPSLFSVQKLGEGGGRLPDRSDRSSTTGSRASGVCVTSTHVPSRVRSHSSSQYAFPSTFFFTSSKSPAYDLLLNR